jgi:hypothetical protein
MMLGNFWKVPKLSKSCELGSGTNQLVVYSL